MHSHSKARQSIKVEKENENIKLRKKNKSMTTDKHLANKRETVWDRLSKVKKAPSTDNILGVMRSRPSITSKTSQRFQTLKQLPFNQSIQLTRNPLLPTASSNNKLSNVTKKCCVQKPSAASGTEKGAFLHIDPIKEIMTARSFSDESKSLLNSKLGSSEDSNEEYELAPIMNSEYDSTSSIVILNNVREFLQQHQKCMTLEDIEIVKDVVKSDSRYRNVDQNPKLFAEILKTQLQNTLKHEFAIKNVLDCLESSGLEQNLQIETTKSINKIVSYSGNNTETQKFEVDIIFKNVPSLDKEIEILRALGEKLEATLKSSTSLRKNHDDLGTDKSIFTPSIAKDKNRRVMSKLRYELYVLTGEYNAEVSVHQIGIRLHMGIINEFYMAQKTIIELKEESSRPFYVPSNLESLQLKRTSFKKLKETPSELMRYLKPKNSKVAFNMLEQDPIFFNNLFNKSVKLWSIPYDLSKNYYYTEEDQHMTMKHSLSEGGDSVLWDQIKDESHTNFTKALIVKDSYYKTLRDTATTSSTFEPPIRGKQRRRIRRYLTPTPTSTCCNPKNTLFKTVLVGIVQMSVFIIFIMALTYPDARC
ncbi:uncharacterized protein LOC119607294 [Lucilia sericata]|uniref:uncharacterized protein LOC119607294 n=1 Tax=Lucilia sericata TaxID=13632 RepID=UPI0018A80668|nr:uncharacterized protein LOC119607294 [Lucilia sericata]